MKNISFFLLTLVMFSAKAQTEDLNDVAINDTKINLTDNSIEDLNKKIEKEAINVVSQDTVSAKKSKWNVSADVNLSSRFIWRGLVLGDHPSIQPNVTFSNGGFFVGVWASYPFAISSDAPNYKEIIPYIGYGGKVGEKSNLTVMILPHYDPNVGGFFDFDNNGATNRLEFRTIYNIGKLDFFAGWDFHNSFPGSDSPLYLEMGYTFDVSNGFKVRPFISGSPNDNYYTTDGKANLTQVGWYTSKSYDLGKGLGVTLKVDMVYNPDRETFDSAINATIKL